MIIVESLIGISLIILLKMLIQSERLLGFPTQETRSTLAKVYQGDLS